MKKNKKKNKVFCSLKKKVWNSEKEHLPTIRITVDEGFIVMADFLDFLYEDYKPDNNGRFVGVNYQDACATGHVTKSVLCKMLETFNDELAHKDGFTYIPVSEEVFDLTVPVEQLKMLKLL